MSNKLNKLLLAATVPLSIVVFYGQPGYADVPLAVAPPIVRQSPQPAAQQSVQQSVRPTPQSTVRQSALPAAQATAQQSAAPSSVQPVRAAKPATQPTASSDEQWQKLQKAGTEAIDSGRFGQAERTLKQAVIKSVVFGEGDLRYAKSLDELGRLYTIRARFGEAEPLLEEALHAKELTLNPETGEIVPVYGAMVSFYLDHGTETKAAPVAEKLLQFVEGKLEDYRSATQGPVTLKAGQPLTGWAGRAAPTMLNPVIEWAITCDAIGNSFKTHGNYDMADRLFKAALDVKETVLGKEHLSLANSFDSLGGICLEKNDDSEAESFFRYALEHTERIVPDERGQVYNRMDKLARCLVKEKKYEEAEAIYLKGLDLWKTPSRNGSEARANFALGNLYVLEKKYDQALPVLQTALKLAEEYYGPNSISLLPYLQRNADLAYYMGQNEQRIELKSRADTISGTTTQPFQ